MPLQFSLLTMLPILLYCFTEWKTIRWLIPFNRIIISLSGCPPFCNTATAILFSCFLNCTFTCMVNYWLEELEVWVESNCRDILQVCSVANPSAKNFSLRRVCIRTYSHIIWYLTAFTPIPPNLYSRKHFCPSDIACNFFTRKLLPRSHLPENNSLPENMGCGFYFQRGQWNKWFFFIFPPEWVQLG